MANRAVNYKGRANASFPVVIEDLDPAVTGNQQREYIISGTNVAFSGPPTDCQVEIKNQAGNWIPIGQYRSDGSDNTQFGPQNLVAWGYGIRFGQFGLQVPDMFYSIIAKDL